MEPSHFTAALSAIERINAAVTPDEMFLHLNEDLGSFGYEFLLFALSPGPQRADFGQLVIHQKWPREWFEHYKRSNFHAHDPVANHVRARLDPFDWNEVPLNDNPVSKTVMNASAVDYGMRRGRCIPIHDHFGYRGAISLAATREPSQATGAVDLIAIFAFNRMNRFRLASRSPRLTLREREVVMWAAAGKTSWDTGAILRVSEKTVQKHLAAAMRKFDSHSKAQVVAECLRAGEISL